jgi:uncharacterized protein (TIGR02246 family)
MTVSTLILGRFFAVGRLCAALALISALGAPLNAWSQAAKPPALTPEQESAHQALRDLKTRMQRALNELNLDALLTEVADDVVFTTMNGDRVRGRDGVKQYFEKMMKGPKPIVASLKAEFEADDLSNLYVNNDVAVIFGTSKDQYRLTNGDAFNVSPQWSGTMVRRDGKWLIANFHYSTNMFDNPVLDAQRKMLIQIALAAAAVAALLAFFFGRSLGQRRTR